MEQAARVLTTLGIVLLLGLATDALGRRLRIPRVTLLLVAGLVLGPGLLDLLPAYGEGAFTLAANMALAMVGFLLGEKFTLAALRENGRLVLWLSVAQVVGTAVVVAAGLVFIGVPLALALLFAGIAPATDPAATADVVRESRAEGRFTRVLLGIVAVDDAWGLIVFSLAMTGATVLAGTGEAGALLMEGGRELIGAVVLGVTLGVPSAYFTGRVARGEPTLVEALGVVLLCGGLALWLEVSFLLAAMVLGATVANLARHHQRPFHAIEGIEWPFMVVFFVFAGASFQLESFLHLGVVGTAYCLLRAAGRLVGAWAGGELAGADSVMRRWMGLALMPQAGVALGMALMAKEKFPAFGEIILPVAVGATIIFELVGPFTTRAALEHSGEGGRAPGRDDSG